MIKRAINTMAVLDALEKIPAPVRALAGGAAGASLGQYVMPRLGGYEDVPEAKNWATLINALEGAGLAVLPGPMKALALKDPAAALKLKIGLPIGVGASELIPQTIASMSKGRTTMNEQTRNTIPAAIQRLATSGMGSGATAGAALAGLGGMATGLTRKRTEDELKNRRSRARMIASDFAKYLMPLMVAGGVTGHMAEKMNTKQASFRLLPKYL